MSKSKYHTRAKSNEGFKLYLIDPATSKPTDDYITIRGMDSDAFREADAQARRDILEVVKDGATEDKDAYSKAVAKAELKCVTALVINWCFDGVEEVPTTEDIVEFFTEAPQVMEFVNTAGAQRANFLTSTCAPSTNGQKKK